MISDSGICPLCHQYRPDLQGCRDVGDCKVVRMAVVFAPLSGSGTALLLQAQWK
jgi:hypothetical protein